MKGFFKNFWGLIVVILIIYSCARPVAPNGGPDDTTAPMVVKEKSSLNFQTNFKTKEIQLEFNEWIDLSNPIKEILISPPTEFFPQYKVKGKKLIITFNENELLKEDVTYQINFGNAIKDFTAGNILKNERFVFSTGDKIDSLKVSGRVIDGITGEPMENIAVLLYDNLNDTAFRTQKPFYFIYSDKTGNFNFQNIKTDSFNIFALEDLNNDYYYSTVGEKVAFFDSLLVLSDSFSNFISLEVFTEEEELEIIKKIKKEYGKMTFVFNKELIDLIKIECDLTHFQELRNDSLFVWYQETDLDSFKIIIPKLDTSWYKVPKKDTTSQKIKFSASQIRKLRYFKDTIKFSHNWPLQEIIIDSILLIDTVTDATIDTIIWSGKDLLINANLNVSSNYEIQFLPNAMKDWLGNTNDSLSYIVKTGSDDDFGYIQLDFENKSDSIQYLIELYQNKKLFSKQILTDTLLYYPNMPIGAYSIKVINDSNFNGKWDTGNLKLKSKPESIFDHQLEELKKGWDLEAKIILE